MKVYRRFIALSLAIVILFHVMLGNEKEAEAVIPAIVADAIVSAVVGAGAHYVAEKIIHVRNDIYFKNEQALNGEGEIKYVGPDALRKMGYKVPEGTTKVYRLKGAAKSALLSAALTVGTSYTLNYFTEESVPAVEGVNIEGSLTAYVSKTSYKWLASGNYISYTDKYVPVPNLVHEIVFQRSKDYATSNRIVMYSVNDDGSVLWSGYHTFGDYYDKDAGDYLESKLKLVYSETGTGMSIYKYDYLDYNYVLVTTVPNGLITGKTYYQVYVSSTDSDAAWRRISVVGYERSHVTGTINVPVDEAKRTVAEQKIGQAVNDNNKVVYVYVNDNGTSDNADDEVAFDVGELTTGDTDYPVSPPDAPSEPQTPPAESSGNPDLRRIYNVFTRKFPFSLPWDVAGILAVLNSDPVTPEFSYEIDLSSLGVGKYPLEFDFHRLDPYMEYVRWFELALFVAGMIYAISRLYGGAT